MIDEDERKRLEAVSRANEVFDALTRVGRMKDFIRTVMANHNEANIHNAGKRDCKAFHARINALGLRDWLRTEGVE